MSIEKRKIRYNVPTRIVAVKGNIENCDILLKEKDEQIYLFEKELVRINGEGFIILDFGKEICGGIRILSSIDQSQDYLTKIRVRFGESVSETCAEINEKGATNNHAQRDLITYLPAYSDELIGNTGFRFVRIDFLGDSKVYHPIKSILSKEVYYDLKPIKTFKSDDELLNKIYDTCVHTVTLCIQNRIWDGIKRDRLVWIGDMETEIHSILHVYGNIEQIETTLNTAELSNPMPCWINNIPSYSAWYLLISYDVYSFDKNKEFIKRHKSYLDEIIKMFDKTINNKGDLDYSWSTLPIAMAYFIDWPTYKEDNEEERKDAIKLLLLYVLPRILTMYQEIGYDYQMIEKMINRLKLANINVPKTKAFAAFYQLVYKDEKSYENLIEGGAKGMSTFMSYYILKAVAQKSKEKALEMLKEYYGGMLSRGATSFWEDFDIDWLKGSSRIDEFPKEGEKDLHGDYGGYCYIGFRHSLCHGWSSGPISFLLEDINNKA